MVAPLSDKNPKAPFEQAIRDMEFVDVAFCESTPDAINGNEAMCTYLSNLLVMYISDYIIRRKKNQPLDSQLLAAVKVAQAATSMATLFKAGSEALLDGNMNMLDLANKELNGVADLIELKLEGFARQMAPGAEVFRTPQPPREPEPAIGVAPKVEVAYESKDPDDIEAIKKSTFSNWAWKPGDKN